MDGAKVCPGPQQMGGERVAKGVGRGAVGQAQSAAKALHQGLGMARTIGSAALGPEQGLFGGQLERHLGQIDLYRLGDRRQDWNDAGLAALAGNAHRALQRRIGEGQGQGLGNAQAAAIEQGQHGAVARHLPRLVLQIAGGLLDQTEGLILADGTGHTGLDLGAAHEAHGGIGHAHAPV